MSKGLGQKIAIKFTQDLIGDVTGKNPPYNVGTAFFRPEGAATASSQYSSYGPSRAFDGSTSSHWYTEDTGTQWIQIQFSEKTYASGFRWYVVSYIPKDFNVYGSDDGETWSLLGSGTTPNSAGWHTFDFLVSGWLYYKWEITNRYLSYIYIYEIQLREASGNEAAFSVTGSEYQYVGGPLIDKTYKIDNVSAYNTMEHSVDFSKGLLNKLSLYDTSLSLSSAPRITDSATVDIVSSTSLVCTVNANTADYVLATISVRSPLTIPPDWTLLHTLPAINSSGIAQTLSFAYKRATDTGDISITVEQAVANKIYISLISVANISGFEYAPEFETIDNSGTNSMVSVPDKDVGEALIWGCTCPLWLTSPPYGPWSTTPADLPLVTLPETIQRRQANFIDLGTGAATGRTFSTVATTAMAVGAVRILLDTQDYGTAVFGPYTLETINQYADSLVRATFGLLAGTQLVLSYSITDTVEEPTEFVPILERPADPLVLEGAAPLTGLVAAADLSDKYLWLKVYMQSSGADALLHSLNFVVRNGDDSKKILLTTDVLSRFNNAVGAVMVSYDKEKGLLVGKGGAVESFSVPFIPTDLAPLPNPGIREAVKPQLGNLETTFTRVCYNNCYAEEAIKPQLGTLSITFTYVGIINP